MKQRELIDKYFRNECSDEERRQVLEYFRNNPEEWNKYMTEEDWDHFKADEELAPGLSEELFEKVSKQTFKKRRPVFRWLAAAAVAALVLALLWSRNTHVVKDGTIFNASARMAERKNDSDTLKRVQLADGSVGILSPHSGIRYYEPFSRTVYLSGKALFQVITNKSRPFIVHSDKLATTVLGTSFTVESFAESNVIRVKLHNGKIQVAVTGSNEILRPGDELIYNKSTMLVSLKRYKPAEQLVKAGPANNTGRNVRRPDWYTFDISPLSEVFDQLSSYYQVDIYYYPSDVQNKYFSGRMHKTDTLETLLNDIAILNHLMITKEKEYYIIRKKD